MRLPVVLGLESLTPPRTGIGRYTAALLSEFLAMPEKIQVSGLRHGVWIQGVETLRRLVVDTPCVQDWRGPVWRRALSWVPGIRSAWQSLRCRYGRWQSKLWPKGSLYHEPNYIAPVLDCPLVVTVHDLSHLRFPQYHPAARVRWLERYLPQTLARAVKIITVSEFARQELLAVFGLPPAKVVAIPLGLEAHFCPPQAQEQKQILTRYGLVPRGYIAAVSTLEPRKNLLRLLEAYSALPCALKQRFPLVLIGPKGWHLKELWLRIEQLMRRGELRWLGYVEEAALPSLYAGAAVFAYPSLYEGFGLPVLEAMGCGAPVLTSKNSAMATWAGEAALLVDPLDVQAIGDRLVQLLEDRELAQTLAARGRVLARKFSWKRCADETLGVYSEVING